MANTISYKNSDYPQLLKQIPNAPKTLYYKGIYDTSIFNQCLGVVGSRRCTPYGEKAVRHILSGLSYSGITIVSGFMYGIDALAHEMALEYGLKTVAVMPCGIDVIHPAEQSILYRRILDSDGLVLSELKAKTPPKKWTYPRRNRIIAGICQAVLVIEAAEDSGSLISCDYANKYMRKVFAVPGSVFSDVSSGTNKIVNEYATAVSSGDEIINYYNSISSATLRSVRKSIDIKEPRADSVFVCKEQSSLSAKIIKLLGSGSLSLDEISLHLGIPITELTAEMTSLQFKGLVSERGGKYYVC